MQQRHALLATTDSPLSIVIASGSMVTSYSPFIIDDLFGQQKKKVLSSHGTGMLHWWKYWENMAPKEKNWEQAQTDHFECFVKAHLHVSLFGDLIP